MVKRWRNILVWGLLLAALAEFWVRGPLRLVQATAWNDFLSPYIQAKAWVQGKDPYSPQTLVSLWPADNRRPLWVDNDIVRGTLEKARGIPSPYPLTTLVLLSAFAVLSWTTAIRLWMLLILAALVGSAWALISICDKRPREPRSLLFLAAILALAPLHTGLATANIAILAVCLGVFAFWSDGAGHTNWAGILLAAATCLKPTVAIGLLIYYLVRRRWKLIALSCGLVAFVEFIGILRSVLGGIPWLTSYLANTHKVFASGSLDDFTQANPIRFNLVNGQVFFFDLLGNRSAANLLCWLLCSALAAWWILLSYRRHDFQLLKISAISVLSLIPIYHRSYDATLLVWPLAWCLLLLHNQKRQLVTLLLIIPFFLPGPALLADLAQSGRIPAFSSHPWWSAIALSHQVWDLIFLSFTLLYFLSVDIRQLPHSTTASKVFGEVTVAKSGEN
jgi:Glycosyltransferase family 87